MLKPIVPAAPREEGLCLEVIMSVCKLYIGQMVIVQKNVVITLTFFGLIL